MGALLGLLEVRECLQPDSKKAAGEVESGPEPGRSRKHWGPRGTLHRGGTGLGSGSQQHPLSRQHYWSRFAKLVSR